MFVIIPSIQMQVLHAASGAPALASTLNQSAFNLGNASGAWLGGIALTSGGGDADLPLVGAAGSVVCLGLLVATFLQERRGRRATTAAAMPAATVPCAAE